MNWPSFKHVIQINIFFCLLTAVEQFVKENASLNYLTIQSNRYQLRTDNICVYELIISNRYAFAYTLSMFDNFKALN